MASSDTRTQRILMIVTLMRSTCLWEHGSLMAKIRFESTEPTTMVMSTVSNFDLMRKTYWISLTSILVRFD